jgi:hypothetical protein
MSSLYSQLCVVLSVAISLGVFGYLLMVIAVSVNNIRVKCRTPFR